MHSVSRIAAVILILSVASCASLEVTSSYDRSADFSRLKTYAWMSDPNPTPEYRVNPDLEAHLRKAVDARLAAKGYQLQTPETADFEIVYHAAVDSQLDAQALDGSYAARQGGTPRPKTPMALEGAVYDYSEGSLIIDMVESKTGRLIWRGSATAGLSGRPSTQEKKDKIDEAVVKILERFPPR